MKRDTRHDVLFEPIAIGPKVLKNRFYATPHATNLGTELPGAEAYYRAVRAEGGWGAINLGHTGISMEGDEAPWVLHRLVDEGDMRNLRLLVDRVHEHDALAGCEIAYPGVGHSGFTTRLPGRGVSQLRGNEWSETSCYAMSKREIRELQDEYVIAAQRALDIGFDLIGLHHRQAGAIGYQFLMPYFNKRTDEYGGSFDNRTRFSRELFERVAELVEGQAALVAGFCVDTRGYGMGDGVRVDEEGIGFVEAFDDVVDLWDVQVDTWPEDSGASRWHEQNWQRPWVEKIKPHTTKPVVGVGRFTDPDVMAKAISSGHLDIIGAARPSISDPFLPKKIEEGRADEIRECIGCNMCVSRVNLGRGRIMCTQNATVGEEYRRAWHPEAFTIVDDPAQAVLIVGAGPAGLEAATVLGKRGMELVHVVDAEAEPGGHLNRISRLRGLAEWHRVVDHRQILIDKLPNVTFVGGTSLTAESVRDYGASIVLLATGARWDGTGVNNVTHRPIDGASDPANKVLTPDDILRHGVRVDADSVVVFDADGYFMAPSLAERFAREGKSVTLIKTGADMEGYLGPSGEGPQMIATLLELGVRIMTSTMLTGITPGHVSVSSLYSDSLIQTIEAGAVVLVTQRLSDTTLYDELMADEEALANSGIELVIRIGDCLEPRVIADAIFDGHRVAREIDSADPARALPMIREHRVIGADDAFYDSMIEPREMSMPSSALAGSVLADLHQRR